MTDENSNPFVNSPETGSEKFIRENMEDAIQRIDRQLIDDYLDWLNNRPVHIPAEDSPEDGA